MKKTALMFLVIGLLVGFAVGNFTKSRRQHKVSVSEPVPEPSIESKPLHSNSFNEQELLLQAIQELDLTTAELEDARNYIEKLELNTHRYNWLVDYWKEKGFGSSNQMMLGIHHDFKPGEDMIAFFGWNKEQVAEIALSGKQAVEAIKEWEGRQAVCIEESERKLVYEIPAMPNEIAEQYLQSMSGIIGSDDMELLSPKLELQFEGSLQDRILSMTIGPVENHMIMNANPDQEYITIKTTPKHGGMTTPHSRSGYSTTSMPYIPGKTFPHRWDHVIKMEGDPMPVGEIKDDGSVVVTGSGSITGHRIRTGDDVE